MGSRDFRPRNWPSNNLEVEKKLGKPNCIVPTSATAPKLSWLYPFISIFVVLKVNQIFKILNFYLVGNPNEFCLLDEVMFPK